MDKPYAAGLVWFRRDLRVHDHAALHHALRHCRQVHAAFVFDEGILEPLPRQDRRVEFIRESLVELDEALRRLGGSQAHGLVVLHGRVHDELPRLARQLDVQAVFANRDDEPAALARDAQVRGELAQLGIALHDSKDHVVFERKDLLTQGGKPYSVFTPYKRAWLAKVDGFDLRPYPVEQHASALAPRPAPLCRPVPDLHAIGFERTNLAQLGIPVGAEGGARLFHEFLRRIDRYDTTRDYPAIDSPSHLGVHLRFGTVSIRELARKAHDLAQAGNPGAATWLGELIWRDFYMQVLANFPHVADEQGMARSFRREYDQVRFDDSARGQALFRAWCEARTGYPLIDAAMMQLHTTGYMHNRLRMVTASFLCKTLGVDWRWGERHFAVHLNDYELASNNGGWQWAASSGTDAQPWFRIFNPVTQSRRFDAQGNFITQYLPRLAKLPAAMRHAPWTARAADLDAAGLVLGRDYPLPIADHDQARAQTLQRYAVVKKAGAGEPGPA